MTRNQQISILGCGWLGFPLAQKLIEKDFQVKGSTTSSLKICLLEKEKINAFLIDIDDFNEDDFVQFVKGSEVIVIAIPPRRKIGDSSSFLKRLKGLFNYIQSNQKVLLVSSTSVYPSTNDWVTEEMNLTPDTKRGELMLQVEQLFQSQFGNNVSIVRMGGLIGENRHPGSFLAGKKDLPNAKSPVNLIHQEDAVELLATIIENEYWGEIVNGVSSNHPNRKEFYVQAALNLGLIPPTFLENQAPVFKLISNAKSVEELGFIYQKYKLI